MSHVCTNFSAYWGSKILCHKVNLINNYLYNNLNCLKYYILALIMQTNQFILEIE